MGVEAERLQHVLDGRWRQVRARARDELRQPAMAPAFGLSPDEHRARVTEQLRLLAKGEGPRLLFPRAYGGGEELGGAITAFETLACGDLSLLVKSGVQFGLFGGAILHLGTERHHARYLGEVMSMALPGCFAMTETGHGSDVQSLRTVATYDPATQEFVVNTPDEDARKDYIGNAARDGRLAVVFAQLETLGERHGVHALLVPIRDEDGHPMPGVTIEDCGHKAGLNGVDNGRLTFTEVRVARDAFLDRYASVDPDGTYTSVIDDESRRFFTMLGTLVQGRVSVSGSALSATKVALTIAARYALARRQFSAPDSDEEVLLMDFRQHQRRLLPAIATTYALDAAQQALVAELHASFLPQDDALPDRRELEAMAAGIKTATTWHATRTIQTCREACGGAGYLSVNRLAELKADTDVFTTFEGDNTVLLQLVAKVMLTDYRDEFGALDTRGMVRFVADQLVDTVVERTAARRFLRTLRRVVPGRDEEADLRDRDWHLELFCWREQHVLGGVAKRLKAGMDAGQDPFSVFNSVQDHVLLAARAHVDLEVIEAFVEFIDACDDDEVADLLDAVCDLHVLRLIEAERGWFLEHGRLGAGWSRRVVATVNALCDELRPHTQLLVDAWAIPDEAIRAPIALGDEARRQNAKRGVASA